MTYSHSIQTISGEPRIEFEGVLYGEDALCEELWLVNIELRGGLPKREQIKAKRQIARLENLLSTLRSAGA